MIQKHTNLTFAEAIIALTEGYVVTKLKQLLVARDTAGSYNLVTTELSPAGQYAVHLTGDAIHEVAFNDVSIDISDDVLLPLDTPCDQTLIALRVHKNAVVEVDKYEPKVNAHLLKVLLDNPDAVFVNAAGTAISALAVFKSSCECKVKAPEPEVVFYPGDCFNARLEDGTTATLMLTMFEGNWILVNISVNRDTPNGNYGFELRTEIFPALEGMDCFPESAFVASMEGCPFFISISPVKK